MLANSYMLYDTASKSWYDYTDANAANGSVDGTAVLDTNNDGLADRVVITVTDAGLGDSDATPNGVFAHTGLLAYQAPGPRAMVLSSVADTGLSGQFVVETVGVKAVDAGGAGMI